MDAKSFFQAVGRVEAGLSKEHPDGVVFITSIDDPLHGVTGGSVCDARLNLAAQCIVRGTHREATPEEIGKFGTEQRQRERHCATEEFRTFAKTHPSVLTEAQAESAGLIPSVQPAGESPGRSPRRA